MSILKIDAWSILEKLKLEAPPAGVKYLSKLLRGTAKLDKKLPLWEKLLMLIKLDDTLQPLIEAFNQHSNIRRFVALLSPLTQVSRPGRTGGAIQKSHEMAKN